MSESSKGSNEGKRHGCRKAFIIMEGGLPSNERSGLEIDVGDIGYNQIDKSDDDGWHE